MNDFRDLVPGDDSEEAASPGICPEDGAAIAEGLEPRRLLRALQRLRRVLTGERPRIYGRTQRLNEHLLRDIGLSRLEDDAGSSRLPAAKVIFRRPKDHQD